MLYDEANGLMKEGIDTSKTRWQLPVFERAIASSVRELNSAEPTIDDLLDVETSYRRVAEYWTRRGDNARAIPPLREGGKYVARAFTLAKAQHPREVSRLDQRCQNLIGEVYLLSRALGPVAHTEFLENLLDADTIEDERDPLRDFAATHPGAVYYKCANLEFEQGNVDVAIRLAEQAAESFGTIRQEMHHGWTYYGMSFGDYGCFYTNETLAVADEQVCAANRGVARILEKLGRQDEALAKYEQNDKQFPHLLGGRLELMLAYCRHAPEKADEFLQELRIESPVEWRVTRAVIQLYARSRGRQGETDQLMSELLATSNLPSEVLTRIRGEQKWFFAGPVPTRLAKFLQDDVRSDPVSAVAAPLPGVDQGNWLTHTPKYGGGINFARVWPNGANCATFAVGFVQSDIEQEVTVALGSDDGFIAWLNGEEIMRYEGPRSYYARSNQKQVTLNAGINPIVVQVAQVGGEWKLSLELETPDGWPASVKWVDRRTLQTDTH